MASISVNSGPIAASRPGSGGRHVEEADVESSIEIRLPNSRPSNFNEKLVFFCEDNDPNHCKLAISNASRLQPADIMHVHSEELIALSISILSHGETEIRAPHAFLAKLKVIDSKNSWAARNMESQAAYIKEQRDAYVAKWGETLPPEKRDVLQAVKKGSPYFIGKLKLEWDAVQHDYVVSGYPCSYEVWVELAVTVLSDKSLEDRNNSNSIPYLQRYGVEAFEGGALKADWQRLAPLSLNGRQQLAAASLDFNPASILLAQIPEVLSQARSLHDKTSDDGLQGLLKMTQGVLGLVQDALVEAGVHPLKPLDKEGVADVRASSQADSQKIRRELENLEKRRQEITKEAEKLEQERTRFNNALRIFEKDRDAHTRSLEERKGEIKASEDALASREKALQESQLDLTRREERLADHQAILLADQQALESAFNEIAAKEEDLLRQQAVLQKLKEEIGQLAFQSTQDTKNK